MAAMDEGGSDPFRVCAPTVRRPAADLRSAASAPGEEPVTGPAEAIPPRTEEPPRDRQNAALDAVARRLMVLHVYGAAPPEVPAEPERVEKSAPINGHSAVPAAPGKVLSFGKRPLAFARAPQAEFVPEPPRPRGHPLDRARRLGRPVPELVPEPAAAPVEPHRSDPPWRRNPLRSPRRFHRPGRAIFSARGCFRMRWSSRPRLSRRGGYCGPRSYGPSARRPDGLPRSRRGGVRYSRSVRRSARRRR